MTARPSTAPGPAGTGPDGIGATGRQPTPESLSDTTSRTPSADTQPEPQNGDQGPAAPLLAGLGVTAVGLFALRRSARAHPPVADEER